MFSCHSWGNQSGVCSALHCDHHTRCCLFVYADGCWSAVAVSVVVGSNHLILVLVRCCGYSCSNNSTAPPHLFLTCYCCCIVIFLISTHIILDTSVRITLSWHEMSCSKWHSVAYSDFWVEIVFKSLALKWHSYPCFIASKMHPWYIQLKPQQSPHPSQRRWSMTLVLTLHFTVWRIVEVSTKYRSSFLWYWE